MLKRAVLLVLTISLFATVTAPAGAAPPVRDTQEMQFAVEDDGEACGFPVRWDIDLVVDFTHFFDQDGNLVREHAQVTELNTVTNVDTGFTVVDGPVRFLQRTLFHDDGTATVEAMGLSVKVQAETGRLFDVGRFVVHVDEDGVPRVIQSAGQHAPREAGGGELGPHILVAFCDVLDA